MPSHYRNFKKFELLLEISKNHGVLEETVFLHSKLFHDHHNVSISGLPINRRSVIGKTISLSSDRMTRVENKNDASLLNNNANNDMMRSVTHEIKYLKDIISSASTIPADSTKFVSSISSTSSVSSHITYCPSDYSKCSVATAMRMSEPTLEKFPECIKGLDVATNLATWHHNHWFRVDNKESNSKEQKFF